MKRLADCDGSIGQSLWHYVRSHCWQVTICWYLLAARDPIALTPPIGDPILEARFNDRAIRLDSRICAMILRKRRCPVMLDIETVRSSFLIENGEIVVDLVLM